MLWLIKKPISRKQKREAKREGDKIIKRLGDVEYRFLGQSKDSKYPYQELYQFYLKQYQENCKYINLVMKPKYFTINQFYFTTLKNSVEKPK